MKYITYFIKFFYRIRFWLIIAPIIVASLVYWKTNNTPRDYTTTCSIYTGIITGVNILSESGVTMTSYTQGSMMDNLLNIITADQTLKQVSLRLYARIMVYGDPHKDNIYTQANNYRNLYNHGRPIHHLIKNLIMTRLTSNVLMKIYLLTKRTIRQIMCMEYTNGISPMLIGKR